MLIGRRRADTVDMDDFRSQLTTVIDEMLARGMEPVFLVVDLPGIDYIKKAHGDESLVKFKDAATNAISSAGRGCDAFSYGEDRIVAILEGFDRLRTFAMADKLRRGLPFLAQSFDVVLVPEFDILEYDRLQGVAGLISQLVRKQKNERDRDVA